MTPGRRLFTVRPCITGLPTFMLPVIIGVRGIMAGTVRDITVGTDGGNSPYSKLMPFERMIVHFSTRALVDARSRGPIP
jgi:hypothetical protein